MVSAPGWDAFLADTRKSAVAEAEPRPSDLRTGFGAALEMAPQRRGIMGPIRRLVHALGNMLLTHRGVRVRGQSHIDPPVGSFNWMTHGDHNLPPGATRVLDVSFFGRSDLDTTVQALKSAIELEVPKTMRAVVTVALCFGYNNTGGATADPLIWVDGMWTLRRNGKALPGFQRLRTFSMMGLHSTGTATSGISVLADVKHHHPQAPLILQAGDTLQFFLENEDVADDIRFAYICGGYMYPLARGQSDHIFVRSED